MVKLIKHNSEKLKQKLAYRIHMKFIYKNKIKMNYLQKKNEIKIPTLFLFLQLPYPSPPAPSYPPAPGCPPHCLIFPTKYKFSFES